MAEGLEKRSAGGLLEDAQSKNTHKTSDPRAHYVYLDGLRGIAILMTVLNHISAIWFKVAQTHLYIPLLGVDLLEFLQMGYLAVPIFFLLSGYLLTWTEEGRKRRGNYSVLNYAKRRVLRIVPAYYMAIAAVILVWSTHPSFGAVTLHLVFLQDFKPSYPLGLDGTWWSLTPEIVFYATLPLLVLKFRRFWQRAAILALLLLISLATRFLQAYSIFGLPALGDIFGISRLYQFPTTLLYLFLVGMLLRMMIEERNKSGREPGYWETHVVSALTVVSVVVLLVFPYLGMASEILLYPVADLVTELMVILVFACVLLGSSVLKPILRLRPLVFIGEISYSLFLLHRTVLVMVSPYLKSATRHGFSGYGEPMVWATFGAFALLVLVLAVVLAYLSYRYIESPFMRHKPK